MGISRRNYNRKSPKSIKHKRKNYSRHKKHHKKNYKKYHKKTHKGGSSLNYSEIGNASRIPTSKILNNVPYSQGFRINLKDSTDYGALANPIPFKSFANCPPKLNFN